MIKSMTGFGNARFETPRQSFSIDLKAINHRYLDVQVRLPYYLRSLEENAQNLIKKYIKRGRVDVFVNHEYDKEQSFTVDVNLEIAKMYKDSLEKLIKELDLKDEISLNQILQFEDIFSKTEEGLDDKETIFLFEKTLNKALKDLDSMRLREGEVIKEDIVESLKKLELSLYELENVTEGAIEEYKESYMKKINSFLDGDSQLDSDRVEQEVVIFIEKSDINEELIRLKGQISEMHKTLSSSDVIGRRLDFILQEMNREVNTIGSKSFSDIVSKFVVDMKTEIEKIREHAQNLE